MSETQTQPVIPSRETSHSHEPLTDERMGELLAGIGNHEGKALLMLAMDAAASEEKFFSGSELNALLVQLPGASTVDLGTKSNQLAWCSRSIAPIGLVAKADYAEPLSYSLTKEGRAQGVPLAGFLLNFSNRYQVSLTELFGESKSRTELRAPLIRFKLIEELITNPVRPSRRQIVEATGVSTQSPVIERHLRKLHNAHLVDYQDWDRAVDEVKYTLIDPNYEPAPHSRPLGRALGQYLRAHRDVSHAELVDYCIATVPEISEWPKDEVSKAITGRLHRLKEREVVKQEKGKRFHEEIKVSFTEVQEQMWTELLDGLEAFRQQDPLFLQHYRTVGHTFISSPSEVQKALERYRAGSSKPSNRLSSLVSEVVNGSSVPLGVREIVRQVSEKKGRAVSHFGVLHLLNKAVELGEFEVSKQRVKEYSGTKKPTS